MLPDLAGPRLQLTGVSNAHRELLIALNSDAEVMRHITGRPATVPEVDEEWRDGVGRDRMWDAVLAIGSVS